MKKLLIASMALALCSCECHFKERIDFEFHGVADIEEDQRLIKPEKEKEPTFNFYNLTKREV
jgi:hypothetical protein